MKTLITALVFLASTLGTQAQSIVRGPVLGGVTENSARIYFRTDSAANLQIDLATDTLFTAPVTYSNSTSAVSFMTAITDLNGLQPDTRYYYRVWVNGVMDTLRGTFRTFPPAGQPGNYRVVVGSCNYHNFYSGGGATSPDTYYNDVLFGSILNFDPHVVIHLGDWNYPPSAFGWNYNLTPSLRAESFDLRYRDYNFRTYLQSNMSVDYVYDDDFSQNGTAGWTYPTVNTIPGPFGTTAYELNDVPLPAGIRTGAIEGYFDNFPGYPQVDTSGVHHSFQLGNIEFFILDTRNSKDPVHEVFQYNAVTGTHTFSPPAGHSTLGQAQRDWLLDGLQNSTADWKVIGSSVVFNQNFNTLMSLLSPAQFVDRSVVELMASLAYMWVGYPEDGDALLNTISTNDIKNVIMLSGDTHSSMMDDGTNAGLPEISSSGWAAGNEGYLNQEIDSVLQTFSLGTVGVKDFLWNGGGNGIDNNSRNDTYAALEFFGTDSMRSCIIDEFDQTLACMTILFEDSTATTNSHLYMPEHDFLLIFPSPAKDKINVSFDPDFIRSGAVIRLISMNGQVVKQWKTENVDRMILELTDVPAGMYFVEADNGDKRLRKRFVRH